MSDQKSRVRFAATVEDAELCEPPRTLEQEDFGAAMAASTSNGDWSPKTWQEREIVRRQMDAYNKARDQQEEAEVKQATRVSLEQSTEVAPKEESLSSPPLIEERINNMAANLDHGLPSLCDANGDTWIFIDPPAQQSAHSDEGYHSYIQRYDAPLLVQAQNLLKLGSSFFETEIKPTRQHRLLRRRGLAGKLPSGIKYVLDLTPPTEGEEAVYLTTELCCPKGVLKWSQSNKRWGVSNTLVGGLEEYTVQLHSPHQSKTTSNPDGSTLGTPLPSDGGEQSLPLEYSPLRHRAAIERVIMALQNQDPQINSAVKLWTTFAVAKSFGITNSPLTDYIVRWLRAYPNSYFLEVLPEVGLKIADGLQCEQLCRDTFAILVGEEALGNIRRYRDGSFSNLYSTHGRKKDDLPEDYQTRVEYASKALFDRVTAIFENLIGADMPWMADLPEFQKLLSIDLPVVVNSNTLVSLKDHLKAYVRGAIMKVLCSDFLQMPNAKDAMNGDDDLYPRTTWTDTWNTLLPCERIMTRSFWRALHKYDICCGASNFNIKFHVAVSTHIVDPATTATEESLLQQKAFERIYKTDIDNLALKLNALLYAHQVRSPDHRSLPRGVTNLPVRGLRHNDSKPGNRDDSDLSATVDPATSGHATTLQAGEGPVDTGLQANVEVSKDTDDLNPANSLFDTLIEAQEANMSGSPVWRFFQFGAFLRDVRAYIGPLCDRMLRSGENCNPSELDLTDTLVCLEDTEWKYLPIWANGNDDGSGGVYNDEVPLAYGGFSTAGPDVHTRTGSSMASSDGFEIIGSQSEDSTRNTSTIVNDGCSSVLDPFRTYAMSEGGESWGTVPAAVTDEGMLMSVDGEDIDEEAWTKWETVRTEHMEEEADPRPKPPTDREMEEELSNAFMEADDNDDDDIEIDDDSSATELGDPFDNEAVDQAMVDPNVEAEDVDEDTVIEGMAFCKATAEDVDEDPVII